MRIGVETSSYAGLYGWSIGSRFNPGPAEVIIHSVSNGILEGTASASMRKESFSTIPFDPNDPGPDVLNVRVDFRYPLRPGGGVFADCPSNYR
jgi:hypothetical protein